MRITKLTISSYIPAKFMKVKISILVFAALVTAVISCKKSGDIAPIVKTAFINIVNASADTLNFYQSGTRLNNTSNLYPSGSLAGLVVTVGTQNYQFKKAGSANSLMEVPITIDTLATHTLFVAGETADKVFLTKDLVPDTGKSVRIRFINASPATTNVDVYVGTNFAYKNVAFKSETPYITVSAGANALSIYQAGTTTLLAGGTLTLTSGPYTLYTKGGITGNTFGARIINR
jgi:hypothetical protein